MDSAQTIQDVLSKLEDSAEGANTLSIDDVMSTFGRRAYGPIIFLVGLISLSPIGSIPGASVFLGAVLIILMVQFLAVDRAPWLPERLRDLAVDADRAKKSIDWIKAICRTFRQILEAKDGELRRKTLELRGSCTCARDVVDVLSSCADPLGRGTTFACNCNYWAGPGFA